MSRSSGNQSDSPWNEFAPLLDGMVARLRKADRQAILLRFYQRMPLKEVGLAMGISEDAAKKRVSRAVLQLRDICTRRGLTAGSAISVALLESNVTRAAPTMVTQVAANAGMHCGSMAVPTSIAKAFQSAMIWGRIKMVAAIAAASVGIIAASVLATRHHRPAASVAVVNVPAAATTQTTTGPVQAARKAIIERLKALQSISADYDIEDSLTPHLPNLPPSPTPPATRAPISGPTIRLKSGTEKSTERFSFLSGSARWESKPSQEKIQQDQQNHIVPITGSVYTFRADVYEQMTERPDGASIRIESRNVPPDAGPIDIGLGLRSGFEGGQGQWWETQGNWLTPAILEQMDATFSEGQVILSRLNRANQKLEWIFDPSRQYALIAFHRRDNQPPFAVMEEVAASDFHPVSGVLLPFTITWRTMNRDGFDLRRWQAKIKEFALNDVSNIAARYHIQPHPGVAVVDMRLPPAAVIAAGKLGDQSDPSTPRGATKALIKSILSGDAVTAKTYFAPADQTEIDALIEQTDAWRLLQEAVAAKFGAPAVATLPRSTIVIFQQMLERVEVYVDGDSARLAMPNSPQSSGVQLIKSQGHWKVQKFPGGGVALTQSALMTTEVLNNLAAETARGQFGSVKEVADQYNRRVMERLQKAGASPKK